ncbi:MAG: hypothetical protein P9M06_04800 [Candidatus Saelkia tenebricola]|nr:hypothetical protein [Candidatus Saelkia tenebricola]
MKYYKFKITLWACFISVSFVVCFSNVSFARRIKGISTQVDNFGTVTHYESYEGSLRPTRIVDRFGHLLESYYYENSELDRVVTTNIKTGEEIELRIEKSEESSRRQASIYIAGEYAGFRSWEISNNWLIFGDISMDEEKRQEGIGSSVANWIMRYSNMVEGIDMAGSFTSATCPNNFTAQNPLIISIMRHLAIPETTIYAAPDIVGVIKLGTNLNNTELIRAVGAFFIGKADDRNFGIEMCEIRIDGNEVVFSEEPSILSPGTELNDFEVLDDWRVVLNGEVIGQIKSFPMDLSVSGEINPIHIFIDEEGRVVQY